MSESILISQTMAAIFKAHFNIYFFFPFRFFLEISYIQIIQSIPQKIKLLLFIMPISTISTSLLFGRTWGRSFNSFGPTIQQSKSHKISSSLQTGIWKSLLQIWKRLEKVLIAPLIYVLASRGLFPIEKLPVLN